jgi:MFS transporter, ACS family, hexuronate transporter
MTPHSADSGETDAVRPGHVRTLPALRWWIAALLFASTVINYIDRQSLSLLAPWLKVRHHWTNTDYANIVVAFRIAYAIGQVLCGRLMDRLGTRQGLTLTVLWYSIVSILTPVARGLYGFMGIRFLLGAGESGNWPAATKAVSEWFPPQERALATAFFDSGSSIGAAVAPFLILPVYLRWGMGPAFVVPGVLGLLWLLVWRAMYRLPQHHPRIEPDELRIILADSADDRSSRRAALRWSQLLRLPQTWGVVSARTLSDPVFFFVADWFPIYLVAKGVSMKTGIFVFWIPFVATDLGNILGGWASGRLIRAGASTSVARKTILVIGAAAIALLIPTIFTASLPILMVLFAVGCFGYGLYTTIANVLPSDLFYPESVASVSGLSGSGAALCTIVVYELAGHLSDARSALGTHRFDPLMILAGIIPIAGMALVLLLARNTRSTEQGLVRPL